MARFFWTFWYQESLADASENCMTLTLTVFDWSTRVTDRQTERRTGNSIYTLQHTSHSLVFAKCLDLDLKKTVLFIFTSLTLANRCSSTSCSHSSAFSCSSETLRRAFVVCHYIPTANIIRQQYTAATLKYNLWSKRQYSTLHQCTK